MRAARKRRSPGGTGLRERDYSTSHESLPPAGEQGKRFAVVIHAERDHRRILTIGPDSSTPELQDALFGDREWFAAHRARRYRVRPVALGEHGDEHTPGPAPTHSIVEEVSPGVRRRVPVHLNAEGIRDLAEIEARTDADEIIGNFVALLKRDRIARVGDAVALAYTGGTA